MPLSQGFRPMAVARVCLIASTVFIACEDLAGQNMPCDPPAALCGSTNNTAILPVGGDYVVNLFTPTSTQPLFLGSGSTIVDNSGDLISTAGYAGFGGGFSSTGSGPGQLLLNNPSMSGQLTLTVNQSYSGNQTLYLDSLAGGTFTNVSGSPVNSVSVDTSSASGTVSIGATNAAVVNIGSSSISSAGTGTPPGSLDFFTGKVVIGTLSNGVGPTEGLEVHEAADGLTSGMKLANDWKPATAGPFPGDGLLIDALDSGGNQVIIGGFGAQASSSTPGGVSSNLFFREMINGVLSYVLTVANGNLGIGAGANAPPSLLSVGPAAQFQVNSSGMVSSASPDLSGTLTLSGGVKVYPFSVTYNPAPICVATDTTTKSAVQVSVSTTSLTIYGTGSDVINYICIAGR